MSDIPSAAESKRNPRWARLVIDLGPGVPKGG